MSERTRMKCACEMSAAELLAERVSKAPPQRAVLIVDHGTRWEVVPFGEHAAGLGAEHITIAAALESAEYHMMMLRRAEPPTEPGEVVTNPEAIAAALSGVRR